ncbi:C-C motif chemokine 1 [Cavia porcellus]|uniref:C-C motif chemokine 1 n=1 Tax=Cavia porcellus TaxID=10141 RepID=UPI002FE11B91
MKVAAVALVCLLLATVWAKDVDSMSLHVASSRCCYSFVERKISHHRIQSYKGTSSSCPYEAVIFKLKGGREICALKTIEWVQDYLTKKKILRLKGK